MAASSEGNLDVAGHVEEGYTSRGLFRRYARGRLRGWKMRQIMTLVGALTLGHLAGWGWGLLSAVFVLSGELVETLALRKGLEDASQGNDVRPILNNTTRASAIQAIFLSGCMVLAAFVVSSPQGAFFCFAFLVAAAVDAGISLPFHRRAVSTKLTTFCLVGVGYLIAELALGQMSGDDMLIAAISAIALGFTTQLFISHTDRHFKRHRTSARALLRRQALLERNRAELQKQQRELRFLSLVARHANDSVVMTDTDRRIVWVNDAFSRITGFSAEEAIGSRPGALLNGPETDVTDVESLNHAIKHAKPHRAELLNITKDGRKIWVETNTVPVRSSNGTVDMFVAIERDITAARKHADDLAQARLDAERGEQAKASFLATMSHEIRTPMNGMIGMSDLLLETELNHDQEHYVRTIQSSATALLRIINDILDFSKLDAGQLELDPIPFEIAACIESVLDLLRIGATKKGLFVDLTYKTELPGLVLGDDGRLRQILLNLIGNAIKFTDAGGISVDVSHEIRDGKIELRLGVQDTGIGIAPDKLETIFNPFSQADSATTRRFGGTGLGLSICKKLIAQMGGSIAATSSTSGDNRGSRFDIRIPLSIAEHANSQEQTKPASIASFEGLRILLAEDNKTNQLLVERHLEPLGVALTIVGDGRAALDQVRMEMFDLVLMDVSMPILNGLDATRSIRASGFTTLPIVAMTANAFVADKEACKAAGMTGFLSKPVRKAELLRAIMEARQPDYDAWSQDKPLRDAI